MSVDQLKEQLLALPVQERADLASFLLATLDDDLEDDPAAVEAAWNEELKRRIEEMDSGKVKMIPAEQVFAEIRKKYS